MLQQAASITLSRALRQAGRREICGFLLVDSAGAQEIFLVRNSSWNVGGFTIAALDAERMERYAERHGYRVHALIHSHWSTLELSDVDKHGLATSKLPWLVVMLDGDSIRYRLYDPASRDQPANTKMNSRSSSLTNDPQWTDKP
jgi:proteasome lid subunit RPN8/RPN11